MPSNEIESVLWNCAQNLTEEQKAQARANIGAASESGGGESNVYIVDIADGTQLLSDPIAFFTDIVSNSLDGKIVYLKYSVEIVPGVKITSYNLVDGLSLPEGYTKESYIEYLITNDLGLQRVLASINLLSLFTYYFIASISPVYGLQLICAWTVETGEGIALDYHTKCCSYYDVDDNGNLVDDDTLIGRAYAVAYSYGYPIKYKGDTDNNIWIEGYVSDFKMVEGYPDRFSIVYNGPAWSSTQSRLISVHYEVTLKGIVPVDRVPCIEKVSEKLIVLGEGNSSNSVIFEVDDLMTHADYQETLYSDILDALLDKKVVILRFALGGGMAAFGETDTSFEVPNGMTRSEFKEMLVRMGYSLLFKATITEGNSGYKIGIQVHPTLGVRVLYLCLMHNLGSDAGVLFEIYDGYLYTSVFSILYDEEGGAYFSREALPSVITALSTDGVKFFSNVFASADGVNYDIDGTCFTWFSSSVLSIRCNGLATNTDDSSKTPVLYESSFSYDPSLDDPSLQMPGCWRQINEDIYFLESTHVHNVIDNAP